MASIVVAVECEDGNKRGIGDLLCGNYLTVKLLVQLNVYLVIACKLLCIIFYLIFTVS